IRTVAMTTAIILKSMLPPMEREISSAACARSGGPRLGNFEGAAIDRGDVEDLAGLAGGVARDLCIPERVAVFHARVARALVDPGVEGGRLPDVESPHAFRRHLFLELIYPDHSGDRDDRRDYRLPDEPAARVGDARADQGRDPENEQVKGPRDQLDDDEDEAGDQPGEGNVHGARNEDTSAPMLPQASKPGTDHGFFPQAARFRPVAQVIQERNAAHRLTNLTIAFPPPGKNLNRTPIFHLAARYKRRSSGTETTARVRIPREPAIGRSKNANIHPSALIMELMKFSSSMAPSTMPRIAGATGKPFSSMTKATRPKASISTTPKIELLMANEPTTQKSRITGISTSRGARSSCLALLIAAIESPGMPNTSAGIHAPASALLLEAPASMMPSMWPVPNFSGSLEKRFDIA